MHKIESKHKDKLFCFIFGREENKEWTLSLFNAINNSRYENPDDIDIETIDDVLYMGKKNDVAFIIQDTLNLYEHQSTFNPNMPLRELMYLSKLYEKYITKNRYNKYSTKRIHLPVPKLLVFYNGKNDFDDTILRLSDLFDNTNSSLEPDVEVSVKMININYGKNQELMESCKVLGEYSWFIDKVRYYAKLMSIEDAVDKTIDELNNTAVLKQFFESHRAEVVDMYLTGYDEEEHMNTIREEGREEGEKRFATLTSYLIKDNRLDDLKKSSEDREYLKKLFEEYNL